MANLDFTFGMNVTLFVTCCISLICALWLAITLSRIRKKSSYHSTFVMRAQIDPHIIQSLEYTFVEFVYLLSLCDIGRSVFLGLDYARVAFGFWEACQRTNPGLSSFFF